MSVRAIMRVAKVKDTPSPYNSIYLWVYYPALPASNEIEEETGVLPCNRDSAPFPVVIFFPGVNIGPEAYHWLALELAQRKMIVVLYSWIAENLPGIIGQTPGVDLHYLRPDTYGSGPTASALPFILDALTQIQAEGILAGALALDQVILGGHSAGGTIALQNANPTHFPGVKAAFAYGAHNAASTMMGFPPETVLPLCSALPLLLIGGTQDGVIAASSRRYGAESKTHHPIERTFSESIIGGRNDSYLVMIDGANHFAIAHPEDTTTGRAFLDQPNTQPGEQIRQLLVDLIAGFIDTHVRKMAAQPLSDHTLIQQFVRK